MTEFNTVISSNSSPAAKGGDAVLVRREATDAEEAFFWEAYEQYQKWKIEEIFPRPTLFHHLRDAMLSAALSTPTEGSASQTEPDVEPGQGSWAKRRAQMEASQTEGVSRDALREALKSAISWIEDLPRKNSSHQMRDDVLDDLRAALATPTEGPASQAEGMGGDALREAWDDFEDENDLVRDGHRHIRYAASHVAFTQAWGNGLEAAQNAARAALTLPEIAEAVPVGDAVRAAKDLRAQTLREGALRERDDLFERASKDRMVGAPVAANWLRAHGAMSHKERAASTPLKIVEAAREEGWAALDSAPATDDRERLVEANHRLMNLLYLADEALMELHGCFPNDEVTEEQRRLKQTCKAIRALTGEDYLNRKGRAAVARATLATEASR